MLSVPSLGVRVTYPLAVIILLVLIELQSTAATFANNLTISAVCVMAALSTQ